MNDLFVSFMLMGALSSGDGLPFWATANQWGLMPQGNGAIALVQARTEFDDSRTLQWRWGTSLAANRYNDVLTPESSPLHPMVDELYGSLRWKVFTVDVGMKRRGLEFMSASENLGSISVTGGHIVESGNARTMPGYNIVMAPIAVPKTGRKLWLTGEFGDYLTLDDRFVDDALIHRTKVFLLYDIAPRLRFTLGLDHYAIWGGDSPLYGRMPLTLDNYIRVATGRHASSAGTKSDQINVIGDQGGGELMRLEWDGDGYGIVFQHDIPYNDMSGMGLQNFPDGVNTLHFGWKDKNRWVSDVVYEYQYTKDQSGLIHDRVATLHDLLNAKVWLSAADGRYHKTVGGRDNYFTNSEYKSAWTYYGRVIGNPLFYPEYRVDPKTGVPYWAVCNNYLSSHHIGVAGKLFRKAPYKLMLTYSDNYGQYSYLKEQGLKQVSGAFMGEIPNVVVKGLTLTYGFFADRGQVYDDTVGVTLGLRYTFSK